jgi:molecular chaperone HtpG
LREQFRVDLRGIVDILSHHLYSSEQVYLRELIQNARDAIEARRRLEPHHTGSIDITPSVRNEPMVVKDNGIGLTGEEMRTLLATIGSSSKRDDFAAARRKFLGQFGIGLLSCFLVADTVEVRSRSARTPDADTILWVGHGDGTFTIGRSEVALDSPGTEVRVQPRHGDLEWCSEATLRRLTTDFAEILDVPVRVAGDLLSMNVPPWDRGVEEQLAWCSERLGFEAMGIVPLDSSLLNVRGLGFVLPYTAAPGHRTGDRIYSNGMLVADSDDQLLPDWAFFCRAVIDAGDLPLTASRESLQETTSLQLVRERLGTRLLGELIMVHGLHQDVFADIIRLHAAGLRALAVRGVDIRDLLRSTLPFTTTQGEKTIEDLLAHDGESIAYVADADAFDAVRDVAIHAGSLVVNASGPHEVDLLQVVNQEQGAQRFTEMTRLDIAQLAHPEPYADIDRGGRLLDAAAAALVDDPVLIEIAHFEPSSRPVLWWPAGQTEGGRRRLPTLVFNANNQTVQKLLRDPTDPLAADTIRALRIVGLLLARTRVPVTGANDLVASLAALTGTA